MAFREAAAKEIARLLAASSESSRKQVQTLRAALEKALAAAEAALETQPRTEPEIASVVEHLTEAATAAAQQAAARVADDSHKTIEALRTEVADHADHIAALTGSLEDAQAQASSLHAELAARRAELQTERTKLDAEKKQNEAARRELSDARTAHKQVDAARRKAETAREEEARARASAEAELRKLHEAFDAARRELSRAVTQLDAAVAEKNELQDDLSAAQARAQAAEAEAGAATSRFKASAARVKELERAVDAHAAALDDELAATLSVFDELLGAFDALAGAATPGDVLTTLVEQLAAEFSRVALFRVNGNRLEGEHQIGFDLPHDITKLVMPLGMDSLLTRAAGSAQVIRLAGGELKDHSRAPFGGTPTSALAVPIVVNGDTLAVVYADDSGQVDRDRPSIARERSARFADALRQHAVELLTRMTIEFKALAELRGYAQSLLDEAQQMYDADAAAGQKGPALRTRLENNIEFARSMYASRATGEGPAAAALFEEQMAATIEVPDTPFSLELAALLQREDATSSTKRSKRGA